MTEAVPASVIGSACYYRKCVWRTRVVDAEVAAVKLAYKDYFSLSVLRQHGVEVGYGPRYARRLYRALLAYARARHLGLGHSEAAAAVQELVPEVKLSAPGFLSEMAQHVVDNYESVLRNRSARLPPTGWATFEDELLRLSPTYVWLYVDELKKRYGKVKVEVAFCDDNRCYPACCGLEPAASWAVSARSSLRLDLLDSVEREFGALTGRDFVDYVVAPSEYAVNLMPSYGGPKLYLFARVQDPAAAAISLTRLQVTVRSLAAELSMPVGEAAPGKEEILRALREVLSAGQVGVE